MRQLCKLDRYDENKTWKGRVLHAPLMDLEIV